MSIAGPRAAVLEDVTLDRRAARCAEILAWTRAVLNDEWVGHGAGSPSAWVAAATGEPFGACKRMLFLGKRLQVMHQTREMFAAGLLSEQIVSVLAEAWAPEIADVFARDEVLLVDWAKRLPYPEAKQVIDTWVAHADPNRVERGNDSAYESRRLHLSAILDGVGVIDGQLDAEGTSTLRAALALLAKRAKGDTRTAAQRRADALVSMAKHTLDSHDNPAGVDRRRPHANISIPYETLLDKTGVGRFDDHPITADAVRRLCCDAGIHRMITTAGSAIIDYGRETRTISPAVWQVLVERDGGCRWPGCEVPAHHCDGHHAIHWADGGPTDPSNLALLCWHHHHTLHEDRWKLEPLGAGHFALTSPTEQIYEFSPPRLNHTHLLQHP